MKLYLRKNDTGTISIRAERVRNKRPFSTRWVTLENTGLMTREVATLKEDLAVLMGDRVPLGIDRVNEG